MLLPWSLSVWYVHYTFGKANWRLDTMQIITEWTRCSGVRGWEMRCALKRSGPVVLQPVDHQAEEAWDSETKCCSMELGRHKNEPWLVCLGVFCLKIGNMCCILRKVCLSVFLKPKSGFVAQVVFKCRVQFPMCWNYQGTLLCPAFYTSFNSILK